MRLTPIRAIRTKCLDCCCGKRTEVTNCPIVRCSLHPYRHGIRPETRARHAAKRKQIS